MHSEDTYAIAQRTHKQQTTQQVTTVTKVVREVKHLKSASSDATDSMDYVPLSLQGGPNSHQDPGYVMGVYPHSQYVNYNHIDSGAYVGNDPVASQYHSHYQDYEQYPSAGQYANTNIPNQNYLNKFSMNEHSGTPPSPSEHTGSTSPLQLGALQQLTQGASGVTFLQAPYEDYR